MNIEDKYYDIPNYEEYYQINPITQQVRSIDRWVNTNGRGRIFLKSKILTQSLDINGYLKVGLCKNNKLKNIRVQIILANMFLPNPNNYPIVRHLNDIKTDNRLENLAWGTAKDNAQDCLKNGNHKSFPGEKHYMWGTKGKSWLNGQTGEKAWNSRVIFDTQTGIFYHGLREAGEAKGINPQTLSGRLKGRSPNKTGLIYV